MNENLDASGESFDAKDIDIEQLLRPGQFANFAGQGKTVENLNIFVNAARRRGEAMDHVLLH